MTARESAACDEQKRDLIARHPYCQVCGLAPSIMLAHIIPQSKANIRAYGKAVIHHRLNLRAVCSIYCNGRASIGCSPVEELALVGRIRAELRGGVEVEL